MYRIRLCKDDQALYYLLNSTYLEYPLAFNINCRPGMANLKPKHVVEETAHVQHVQT